MTQISASRTSWIWLVVRHMMLPKIEAWWAISIEATLMAKINPTYLLRSPVSILTATKFTESPPTIRPSAGVLARRARGPGSEFSSSISASVRPAALQCTVHS